MRKTPRGLKASSRAFVGLLAAVVILTWTLNDVRVQRHPALRVPALICRCAARARTVAARTAAAAELFHLQPGVFYPSYRSLLL